VRGLYPKGQYLGIVNQQVVAEGPSRYRVEDMTREAFLKWTGGIETDIIPTIVVRVGHEDEKPQVILIEKSPKALVAFHTTGVKLMEWQGVAIPVANELETDLSLDRFWCRIRFVGPDVRPYITMAVSRRTDSPCFPMTFFIDTGSPVNYIKRSAFDRIVLTERPSHGQKVIYIGGVEFHFDKPGIDEVANNINLIGTSVIYKHPYIRSAFDQACALFDLNGVAEVGREGPPEADDWK